MNTHLSILKWIFPAAMACMFATSVAAEPVHEVRPLNAPIDTLTVHGSVDVLLIQDNTPRIEIDADSTLAKLIKTSVDHGTLDIDTASFATIEFPWSHKDHPIITVHVPTLQKIALVGSADVAVDAWSQPGDLLLELKSSGDLRISHLAVRKITTAIMGSADVDLQGVAAEQDVRITGSGDYRADSLKTGNAAIAIMGSGDVSIWAEKSLAVTIDGSGDVEYFGSPTLAQSIKGSGNVTARGPKP